MSKTEKPNTPAKSWRNVIKIHPACDLFPMMRPTSSRRSARISAEMA